jgi:seryl-tRNA synthetase
LLREKSSGALFWRSFSKFNSEKNKMLDIKWIRENPQKFDAAMAARSANFKAAEILALDEEKRKKTFLIQELQAKRNKIAQEISVLKRSGADASALLEESKKINLELAAAESDSSLDEKLEALLLTIPNIPDVSVPHGKSEEENVEVEKFGSPKKFSFPPKSHDELGEKLKMLDFEQSALMSGARFSTLLGGLARLERALSNFMLDVALESGYEEISPPNLVKSQAMQFSGQLPKFSEEAFSTSDGYWLIPTAEVSLVNLVAKKTLNETQLPIRFTAYTPCFRREAGSAGKDTRGMIRQHQFKKVELVSITTAEDSAAEHERMTNVSCEVLRRLELPFRKILLCSGDMGFCAQKTYDLEVWLPSQEKYREISSCSNCGDFQSRRAAIKYKNKEGKSVFVHTLNGSSLAVGRTLVAILENYQNEDGSISVPAALVSYMNGVAKISA